MTTNDVTALRGWGITVLRVVVGLVFVAHGSQKLFIYGFNGVADLMRHLGIPGPMLAGVLVTAAESLGGLALVLGLCTRWAALLLASTMAVAIFTVHLQGGFFLPNGYEYALTLLAANIGLALTGAGEAALENVLAKHGVWQSLPAERPAHVRHH